MDFVFEQIADFLAQLVSAPTLVVIFIMLIGLGYLLQVVAWPPNRFIPLVLCAVAILACVRLGEPGIVGPDVPHPKERLAVIGVIVWLLAWLAHKLFLQRLEAKVLKWFSSKSSEPQTKPKESENE